MNSLHDHSAPPRVLQSRGRRIALNTLMLYVRMAAITTVSLYTSRIVINALGVEDYGIYSLVGAIVVLFGFLNAAMASATQRFLNFELGRGSVEGASRVFSIAMGVHVCIAVLVVVLAETLGIWLLEQKLSVPVNRHGAALWTYQFSVLATMASIIRIPYEATLVSHERMSFFAIAGLAEAFAKLAIAYWVLVAVGDRLRLYAVLVASMCIALLFAYHFYCRRSFSTAIYKLTWDRRLFTEMFKFSGWSVLGNFANTCSWQGISLVLNGFCGVVVNAAMGIATQINAAIFQFVSNFQTAFNPQITKAYAAGEQQYFHDLVNRGSKYSFYLMLLVALPFYLNAEYVLKLWLGVVPEHTVTFVQLTLGAMLITTVNGPLWIAAQATGRISRYQVMVSAIILTNLPLSYAAIRVGKPPEAVLVINVLVNLVLTAARLVFLGRHVNLSVIGFCREVLGRCVLVLGASLPLPALHVVYFGRSSLTLLVASTAVSVASVGASVYFLGISRQERRVAIRMAGDAIVARWLRKKTAPSV